MRQAHAYFSFIILLRNYLFLLRKEGMSNLLEVDRMEYLVEHRYLDHLLLGRKHNRKHHKHIFSSFFKFFKLNNNINVSHSFFLNTEDVPRLLYLLFYLLYL